MKNYIGSFFILIFLAILLSCQNEKANSPEKKTLAKYEKYGIDTKTRQVYEGLAVGDIAPDFSGKDQYGNEHTLSSLTQDNSLVIIFYRGQWCAICNKYLSKFAGDLDTLIVLGAKVIAISPELPEIAQKTAENTGLKIPIISDLDRSIMDAYKVSFKVTEKYQQMILDKLKTDIARNNGAEEAWLPIPATYVIGTDKRIKYVHYDPNYKVRASIQGIVKYL